MQNNTKMPVKSIFGLNRKESGFEQFGYYHFLIHLVEFMRLSVDCYS